MTEYADIEIAKPLVIFFFGSLEISSSPIVKLHPHRIRKYLGPIYD
jgi:hypothetical protein